MALGTITQKTIIDVLRRDHRRMKELFTDFETAGFESRKEIVCEAIDLIGSHDAVEKKLLYPAAKRGSKVDQDVVLSCQEAHHVVNVILTELKVLPYSDRYFAKFSKLASAIREHIQEEENELFPQLEDSDLDLAELGEQAERMQENLRSGIGSKLGIGVGSLFGLGVLAAVGLYLYSALSNRD